MKHTRKTAWDDVATYARHCVTEDLDVEVAVIGGGLTGILTAYELARAGRKVAVFDANHLGEGVTRYTTAFLAQDIDTDLSDLVSMFGKASARRIWQSHGRAIDRIEEIIQRENIDCDFKRCPLYVYANEADDLKLLADEKDSADELGFDTVFRKTKTPFTDHGYWEIKRQAKFHPLKFMFAVAEKAEAAGARIFEKSEVTKISGSKRLRLTVNGKTVKADKVVIATYQPLTNPQPTVLRKAMYVSYVFEVKIPKGLFKAATYLDSSSPYHYFRIDSGKGYDTMIVGGEDHRQDIKVSPAKNYRALKEYVKELLKGKKFEIIRRWDGPILEPVSGLALIGKTVKANQYVATAFSGNGMTYAMIAADLLRDLFAGKNNPDIKLYDPARHITLKQLYHKGKDYGEEFFGGALKNTVRY